MSLEQIVTGVIQRDFMQIAEHVENDLKAAVAPHSRSGMALGAIHIEPKGFDSIFVGGSDGTGEGKTGTDHLAMLNDGNGSKRIYPKRARGLYLKDYGIWRGAVDPYRGIHFVEKVANKYR